jgi:hypothetical protein
MYGTERSRLRDVDESTLDSEGFTPARGTDMRWNLRTLCNVSTPIGVETDEVGALSHNRGSDEGNTIHTSDASTGRWVASTRRFDPRRRKSPGVASGAYP